MEKTPREVVESLFTVRNNYFNLKSNLDDMLRGKNITAAQLEIIYILSKEEHGLTMTKLANLYGCKVPTLHGIVTRLKKTGYIDIHINKSDVRVKNVIITGDGFRFLEKLGIR